MTNSKSPALPCTEYSGDDVWARHLGLSKRECFAAMAMQGLCVPAIPGSHNSDDQWENQSKAQHAVRLADALLAELAKSQETK